MYLIEEAHPLKQGLKPERLDLHFDPEIRIEEAHPLKQGLKHTRYASEIRKVLKLKKHIH